MDLLKDTCPTCFRYECEHKAYRRGFTDGLRTGYVAGYSDAVLGVMPPAELRPVIASTIMESINASSVPRREITLSDNCYEQFQRHQKLIAHDERRLLACRKFANPRCKAVGICVCGEC